MNANTDTDGLLKALQKLDETGRGLFIEYLPTDKVKDVLLLLLRERDAMPVLQNQSLPHVSQARRPLFLQQPLAYTPFAMHPVPAQEPVTTSNKRSISTAIDDNSKRARIDATVAQNAKQSAAQTLVKEEEDIIEITSEAGHAEAETDVQSKAKDICEPADLDMHLRIPRPSGPVMWKNMDDLPIPVRAELERHFKEMWLSGKKKAQKYAKFTHSPAKYMMRKCCISSLYICDGPSRTDDSEGREPKKTADDRCIRIHRPCAYFAKYKDRYIIHLVPLPLRFRKGKSWTEIDYWVNSRGS